MHRRHIAAGLLALAITLGWPADAMARRITVEATAYGPPWNAMEGTGITSTGVSLRKGQQKLVVAVDPRVIPYGTKLRIPNNPFGNPNLIFTAADTGDAIKGDRLDFFIAGGRGLQNRWGRRNTTVEIVGRGSPKDVAILGDSAGVQNPALARAASPGPSSTALASARRQAAASWLLSNSEDPLQLVSDVQNAEDQTPAATGTDAPPASGGGREPVRMTLQRRPTGQLKELFWQGQGGIDVKNGARVPQGFVSGHTDHVHVASGPKQIVWIGRQAQEMGLHVGENSHFNGGQRVTGGHAPNSYHYRDMAIDVSGDPGRMRAFARWVARHYGVRT